jgi:hypothetical protein
MLDREVTAFCYPNGDYDGAVRQRVVEAGYSCAVGTLAGLNGADTDRFALRRIHTERDLAHFVQSTCGFEEIKSRLRGGGPIESRTPSRRRIESQADSLREAV